VAVGRRIAVIGGGNTAIDCARAARRVGGEEVTILYRRSRAEMPALPEDVASIQAEGIKLQLLAAPRRVISENGKVSALECFRIELGAPDESGRPQPVIIKGSEFIVPVDTVIAAVGQTPETEFLREAGVPVNRRGIIEVAAGTCETALRGVFAGGDSAGGKAFVADAIADGKKAALSIFCFLEGRESARELEKLRIGSGSAFSFHSLVSPQENEVDLKKIVRLEELNTICAPYSRSNKNPDWLKPEERVNSFGEAVGGLEPGKMEAETARCFKCGTCTQCDLCFLLCPDISITKMGTDGYSVRTEYCKGCGICATSCPRHVLQMGGDR
jgi:heterodisulfide reductase subunit A